MKPVRRVVMVLWDGFGSCFLRHLPKLPNLKRLADRSVRFPQCRTVYPTVTNVAWTAMMTGAYPEKNPQFGLLLGPGRRRGVRPAPPLQPGEHRGSAGAGREDERIRRHVHFC